MATKIIICFYTGRQIKMLLRVWVVLDFSAGVAAEGAVILRTPAPKCGLHQQDRPCGGCRHCVTLKGMLRGFAVRMTIQALHRPVCYNPT